MKTTDLRAMYTLLGTLERPYHLLVIEGSDDFFRDDCVARYRALWRTSVADGEEERLSAGDLLAKRQEVEGGRSLFGTKTLYLVEGASEVKGKKSEELSSIVNLAHEDRFFLFVDADGIPKNLAALAEANGALFSLPSMKPWDRLPFLVSWIQAFAKKRGKEIEREAASTLAQVYSTDRFGLIGELEKLFLYRLDEPTITMHDVKELGTIETQPTMWQLLDGLLAGDAKAIATSLVQSSDMHDIAALRFIKSQLEKLVMALEEGTPARNKAQERQMHTVRKRGAGTIVAWINRVKMQEVAIRSGLEEAEESTLLPFFLSLEGRDATVSPAKRFR